MARAGNIQTDPFFELLTDALRAGPGSPAWHNAVQKLRGAGAEGSDEYKLLCAARERLESGREFRSVRAGPDFTRRLFTELESVPAGRSPGRSGRRVGSTRPEAEPGQACREARNRRAAGAAAGAVIAAAAGERSRGKRRGEDRVSHRSFFAPAPAADHVVRMRAMRPRERCDGRSHRSAL
ncbi:MAG: hypothetical protein KY463_06835 [Actinobacteria bacterium]|nr:hypothetical protein [Actinomycetota bacterium]